MNIQNGIGEVSAGTACYDDLFANIAIIYELNSVGGPLHIVLDDGNTDDESIQFSLDTCRDDWSVVEDVENAELMIQLVEEVGRQLLELNEPERDRLYETRWRRPAYRSNNRAAQ